MDFQDAERALKAIYNHSNSSIDEHRKQLNVMYDGSWDITSRRVIKTLHRVVAVAAPALRVVPHHKWMEMSIGFDASDYPKNMVGAGQLPLVVSLTIANIRLHHALIDGGQLSKSCKFPCPCSLLHARSQEWARAPSFHVVVSPSR
jgi:hypothetical protein